MRIEQAREEIQQLQRYIELYEAYNDTEDDLRRSIFKYFAETGSEHKVWDMLRADGYTVRNTVNNWVSVKIDMIRDVIRTPRPTSEFENLVAKLFMQKYPFVRNHPAPSGEIHQANVIIQDVTQKKVDNP